MCYIQHKGQKILSYSKAIPENTLISVCCEILDISEFDEDIFEQKIERILIPAPNELTFVFRDGHEILEQWKDRSRSESWTDEMRKATGERSKKWHEKSQ